MVSTLDLNLWLLPPAKMIKQKLIIEVILYLYEKLTII